MSLMLDKITITKTKNKGFASVSISDEDDATLVLNGFVIDITDGANPVNIITYNGSSVISGNVVNGIKDLILEVFQSLSEIEFGIFEYCNEEIMQL